MAIYSIRKMMMIVAGAAVCFAIFTIFARYDVSKCTWSRLSQCESNMHNVALAVMSYYQSNGSFPSGTVPNSSLRPEDRLGLYVPVSPYLEYADRYNEIDQTRPWHSGFNRNLAGTKLGILNCPNSIRVAPTSPQPTTSIGIAGTGADAPLLTTTDPRAGVFGYDRTATLADIKDGTSTTMTLAESDRVIGSWLQGGPATVRGLDPTNAPYIGPGRQFGGLHDDVAVIAMPDGSVRVVSESINLKVFSKRYRRSPGARNCQRTGLNESSNAGRTPSLAPRLNERPRAHRPRSTP